VPQVPILLKYQLPFEIPAFGKMHDLHFLQCTVPSTIVRKQSSGCWLEADKSLSKK
jgi:hypothetical protein